MTNETPADTPDLGPLSGLFSRDGKPPAHVDSITTGPVRLRITNALRELNRLSLTRDADVADFEKVADALEAATALLEDKPSRKPDRWENSATMGVLNSFAPVLIADPDPDDPILYRTRTTFHKEHEGFDDLTHGGVLSLIIDQACGAAAALAGTPAMTGTLTIRFERPAPFDSELVFVAKVDRTEGRKVFTSGAVLNGEETCARFEAVMIQPR